jgi:hypothetical protein
VRNTDFDDAETMTAKAREHFRRYSGVRPDQLGENGFHGVTSQCLESAVDVARNESQRRSRKAVPALPHEPPVSTVSPLDPETDGCVRLLLICRHNQPFYIRRIELTVGIAERDPRVACPERRFESAPKR